MSNQRTGRLKRGDSDDDTEGPQLFPDSHETEKAMKKKQAFTSLRGSDIDDDGDWPPPPSHKVSVATYDVPHFGGVTKEGTGEDMLTPGKQSSVAHYHGMAELEESVTEDLPLREESDSSKGVTAVSPSAGQSGASLPRSRNYRIHQPLPGAFREGGSTKDDEEETVSFHEDTVQPAPDESDKSHLVAAELVQDPILVSAAKLTWYVLMCF